jgi:hypothetical protein
MNKNIQGFFCKPGLPLSPILKEWIWLNTEITKKWLMVKDVPWWYNERALLSIFAGAVWNKNSIAFEEYVSEKWEISKRTSKFKKHYRGRIDLYFEIDESKFIVEAKRCWSGASVLNKNTNEKLLTKLGKAISDINKVKPYGERRLAILFVNPYFRKSCFNEINLKIKEWLKLFYQINCDASAWTFPSIVRNLKGDDGFYHPGTALMIKEI